MEDALTRTTDILALLNINHCLIGGYAIAVHGVPRHTADVDFLADFSSRQEKELLNFLRDKKFRFHHQRAPLTDPLGDIIGLDLEMPVQIIRAKWLWEKRAVANAITIPYHGLKLHVASAEDLIILKLRAGGPLDLYDVQNILACKKGELDLSLLQELAAKFRVSRKLAQLLAQKA